MGEQQRISLQNVGPTILLLLAIISPCVVTSNEGEESAKVESLKETKLKVLSFGGNGNIGSAVLARMIETDNFDIVMTTRGGWHWDSDTRIGQSVYQI